ncbi:MAG: F0F1 ATP synthase subunit A [Bacteroidales bacterium]|nr:F0F1 ATP synthase subunit A [Bacteroidales bacterium]
MKKLLLGISIAVFLIFTANFAKANENNVSEKASAATEEEQNAPQKFNPGPFIIEHVIDSYGWHITGDGDKSVTIPLPVILFEHWKPTVFMSGKFHHGHSAYNGYAIGFTEEHKGKIVKLAGEYADYSGSLEDIIAKEGIEKDDVKAMAALVDEQATSDIFDISITKNVCSLFISIIILICLFLHIAKKYKQHENEAPHGVQGWIEPLIIFIRDEVAIPSLGENRYQKYFPYLLTLFFFILVNNLMGLIPFFPGGANLTGNIAITGILAVITFLITSFSADKNYWKHLVNTPGVPWFLKFPIPLMPLVEIIGIFTKPFVLMVRLFANITAGHIIALGVISLIFIFGGMNVGLGYGVSIVSLVFYVFMGLLECIVAFIQAFVFTLLTAMFTGMAMESDHE